MLSREEIVEFWKQHAYCEKKAAEAKTPRDTAKILIRPYVLYEDWTYEELEDCNMGNGYTHIGGYAFEEDERGKILKMHDVPRGRIAVTKVHGKPCGYVTFSLAEIYAEVAGELEKPQQQTLW